MGFFVVSCICLKADTVLITSLGVSTGLLLTEISIELQSFDLHLGIQEDGVDTAHYFKINQLLSLFL